MSDIAVPSPRTCLLTVTNSCCLQCKMCRLWQLDTRDEEVSIEDCKKFVDSLSQCGAHPLEVHLIGGESLLKKGILELISHIASRGCRTVITSSGYPIDEKMAQALIGSGLSMLNISLESLNPKVHNALRGKDDCFERAMKAIEYCGNHKKGNFKLGLNTIILAQNLEDILSLTRWVNDNPHLDSIYFMALMRPFGAPVDWQWQRKEEYAYLWPQDPDRAEAVLDGLIALKRPGSKLENPVGQLKDFKAYFRNPSSFIRARRCNLTHHAINVNALGDAYLCFFMDKLGNIKTENILERWNSSEAHAVRDKMGACKNNCELVVNCYYGD
jgi:MoaA/NifB/PqqE/SkfB family radical SAM enzyme